MKRLLAVALCGSSLAFPHAAREDVAVPQQVRVLVLISAFALLGAAQPAIPSAEARDAFHEASALCTADAGRLWGVSLCGPMMFVDPATYEAIANRPVSGAQRDGDVYRFNLPKDSTIANTSIDFQGKRWIQILWPLPKQPDARAVLLMHESYHRIQPQIGLQGSGGLGTNSHLDGKNARIWMRAEIHALRAALSSAGTARREALRAALAFRAARRAQFPHAAVEENALEINEGLAESTGIDAGLPGKRRTAFALHDLQRLEAAPSFVREFPYGTGPAYAQLLDARRPLWRKSVRDDSNLGALAQKAYGIAALPNPERALSRYGGASIVAEEDARAQRNAVRNARYSAELLTPSALTLPICKLSMSFNPSSVEQFENHGSVYHTLRISDSWGVLDVNGGDSLISPQFNRVTLPAPAQFDDTTASGTGWSVKLTPPYRFRKAADGTPVMANACR